MASFNPFRRRPGPNRPPAAAQAAAHTKTLAPAPGAATWLLSSQARWGARSYHRLAEEGYRRNVVAHRCVRLIAECAAAVPLTLSAGTTRAADDHPVRRLLAEPNPQTGGTAFLETVHAQLQIGGNAFIEAMADADGRPRALYPLRPDRVRVVPGPAGWPRAYDYQVDGRTRRLPVAETRGRRPVLHLKTYHPLDDQYGLSPLDAAAFGVDVHNAAVAWNKGLLDNAARPSGALVFDPGDGRPATLSEDQVQRLKAELAEQYQGGGNAGRPFLLEGGLKWQPMALTPADMDFMELKHSAARDIALAFGVPPMLLGIPGDNTYANYQEANRAFWRLTLLPLVARTLDSLSRWLSGWYGERLALAADRNALPALAADQEALWRRVAAAPFLTVNEQRAQLGLDPLPGGDRLPGTPPDAD
ncbi:HK97 family phage portal protein [Rhodothalassium salexigens DSM 2132]|uniref:HK97 family phage portal protein n=1 Tax=Rhodothalassium salexigens DSM 2132 TaxID=1188247 RepID=A0A4R2PL73_RHOSA|nr:phage portal protein [Rhodothalassium salexigens]MBB4210990.1 HK97 family phage portal protein [Rhodothalassium salexigens DSM 2132]MBK1638721.1 phage portal protein [Rhodothalassium salexigens DSM 2132]TCP36352.1 HK97 family phage portal protein [Rhodothalassium salexigens DSM 2132]